MIVRRTWREIRQRYPFSRPEHRWCTGWYVLGVLPVFISKGTWS